MEKEAKREEEAAIGAKCVDGSMGVPEPVPRGRIEAWADKKARGLFEPERKRRELAWNVSDVEDLGHALVALFVISWGVVLGAAGWVVSAVEGYRWMGVVSVPMMALISLWLARAWFAACERHDYEREVWRRSVKGAEDSELYNDMHLAGELRAIASETPNAFGTEGLTENERAAIKTAADRLVSREGSE